MLYLAKKTLFLSSLFGTGHDLNEKDELGFSPLHLAALLGRYEILQLMFKLNYDEQRVWTNSIL